MVYSRISNISMGEGVVQSMLRNRTQLIELQEQISTGKRVDKPSDDANAAFDILTTNTTLNKIASYSKNVDAAQSEVDIVDSVLQQALDVVSRANELTVEAANGTNNTTQLNAIATEVDQLVQTIKDIANTKFGDKYIFGGLNTETPPFSEVATGEVRYMGTPSTSYAREIEISQNTKITVNLSGSDLFGEYYTSDATTTPPTMTGSGLFNTLLTLSQELKKNPADYNAIRLKLDDLNRDQETFLNAQATIGGVANRLTMTKNKLEDDKTTFTKFKSNAEDIDLAKAISDMSYQQTALQASLSVGGKVVQMSLLNYL